LGSFVFGTVGDRHGRLVALRWSVGFILLGGVGIGCIPSAETWGVWTAVLLGVCVAAHTFGGGGEFSGSALLSIEHAPPGQEGITSGMLCVFAVIGIVVASLVVTLTSSLGWRMAFLSCVPLSFVAWWLITTSQENYDRKSHKPTADLSLITIIRIYPKEICTAFAWIGLFSVAYYMPFVFLHAFVPLLGYVPQPQMSLMNTFSLVAYMLGLGISGWLANHRRERIMMIGGVLFLIIVAYPALVVIVHPSSWQQVAVAQAVLALGAGLFVGPIHAASASLFPVAVRYRCVALSSTLAWSLLGGTTPWICMLLWEHTQTPWSVCCWLWGACALALCGFIFGARDVRATVTTEHSCAH